MSNLQEKINTEPAPVLPATLAALEPGKTVAVYGAGAIATELIRLLQRKKIRVSHVLDAKAAGKTIEGFTVMHPDAEELAPDFCKSMPLLLGIFNCFVDIPALRRSLAGYGWADILEYTEIHAVWPEELGDHFWLTGRSLYQRHAKAITEVDALWADNYSRQLYREILQFRCTGDQSKLRAPHQESQYFPRYAPAWKTPLRLIASGAFDGDTVRALQARHIDVEAIAAFEPDAANFFKLSATLNAWTSGPSERIAFPCGSWGRTCQLRFNSDNGPGSSISQSGGTVIQCVSIDDALPGFRPSLIKMDIEGAETEALLGAKKTIESARPGLAVCVYHKPDDLWEIPALVKSWNLGYSLHLDIHMHNGLDLVMYAIPRN